MKGLRKDIAAGILTVMTVGLISNALAVWKDQAVIQNRIKEVEKKQEKQDNINKQMVQQMNNLHWYLIESKGIKVPPKGK